ncbi:hypothetical protein E2C01_072034 [Portunus trituberculatus]|uniref:Uncharacterized protein n=1 Tax=Portunus trituberculatus TaxID=210409 RepID=A0A5B7I7V5_PORTR|nr:hypothetical protein [Portunus trituberculatus]
MSSIKILRNDVFHALSGLNPRNAYRPCLAKLFQPCLSTSTFFASCWKFAYIQFINLSSKGRFLNICHFTDFYLIACMASVKVAPLVIS